MEQKELVNILTNMHAEIALQQEELQVIFRKAKGLLSKDELDHVNSCVTNFAHLFGNTNRMLGVETGGNG